MDRIVLRRYLPAILLLVGVALLWSARSQSAIPLAGSLQTVLPQLSGYRVTNQRISDEERRIVGMTDYQARAFWRDTSVAFTTYVGYYDRQTQGKSMHSPRNCLPGAGWEIMTADTGSVVAGGRPYVVNKYLLKNGNLQSVVYYWYQGRGRVVASEYAVKWNLLRDAALLGHTEEALVRIVVYVRASSLGNKTVFDRAVADAERLGREVGARLLVDMAHVLPGEAPAGVGSRRSDQPSETVALSPR